MGTKAENSRKIRELEEELSDEKIAELFQIDGENAAQSEMWVSHSRRLTARHLIVILGIVLGIVIALQFFTARIVNERSMEDTIAPRDCIILALKAYNFSEIQNGDIIMIETYILDERGYARDLIKRVIGLPGDTIEIRDGGVYRNGQLLQEPYMKGDYTGGDIAPEKVPDGRLFVLGDNRQISIDSRDVRVGYVEFEQIIGKVVFRLLPFSRIGPLA